MPKFDNAERADYLLFEIDETTARAQGSDSQDIAFDLFQEIFSSFMIAMLRVRKLQ